MDGLPQDQASLEDRIRRMILFNTPVPDQAGEDTRPRVRLPPSNSTSNPSSGQPSPAPYQNANGYMRNGGSASPASPHNANFAPPSHPPSHRLPGFVPPHLRNRGPQQHQVALASAHPQINPSHGGPPGPLHRGNVNLRQQRNQQIQLDPDAFRRTGPGAGQYRPPPPNGRNLYNPNANSAQPKFPSRNAARQLQGQYLDRVASREIPTVDMTPAERSEKEAFRVSLEKVCHDVCQANPDLPSVSLECFGSFQSGFASAGSDMDLAIVVRDNKSADACSSMMETDLPRSLEKALLKAGYGARLLTRTRVPIIKICQLPSESLLDRLRAEREKWDWLPNEKKYPHLFKNEDDEGDDDTFQITAPLQQTDDQGTIFANVTVTAPAVADNGENSSRQEAQVTSATVGATGIAGEGKQATQQKRDQAKTWTRERKAGPLDFPKDGVGIQCDINFFNPLGLHNTQLLRCYSKCDPRVRPMILFVKSWAKQRKINSSYSGTLSSYGYVLMVLHYLMNIAQPQVLPNLQLEWRPSPNCAPLGYSRTEVDGWVVDFWRNEEEIEAALRNGQMSSNQESVGSLLAGFFQYYSSQRGQYPQFVWTQQVLSLRTPGGIIGKDQKGWVKATTEEGDGKKIQHRYLFCIEDPFELAHNVARTVTHNGIVAIRDEFRRASRILTDITDGIPPRDGELFDKMLETEDFLQATEILKREFSQTPSNANTTILYPGSGDFKQAQPRPYLRQQGKKPQNTQQAPNQQPAQSRAPSQPGKAHAATKQSLNVTDQAAFPTLGDARSKAKKQRGTSGSGNANSKDKLNNSNSKEISGDQAAAYLEEFRRKKAEDALESTAHGAAEAVLNGA